MTSGERWDSEHSTRCAPNRSRQSTLVGKRGVGSAWPRANQIPAGRGPLVLDAALQVAGEWPAVATVEEVW